MVAVSKAARELVHCARVGDGPGFIEAVTYRWRGHVGPREDIDVGLRRKGEDLAAWKKRDPVERLVKAMVARGDISRSDYEEVVSERRTMVRGALNEALKAPHPEPGSLLDNVYAKKAGA